MLLLTTDKALNDVFTKACDRRKAVAETVVSAQQSRARWVDEDSRLVGVVADTALMHPQEVYTLLQSHCEPGAPPVILLDHPQVPDPRAPREVITRLRWPLPASFVDALKEIAATPMVFFTDSTLFFTGMLQARLQSVGITPIISESQVGIIETLREGAGLPKPGEDKKPGSLWDKLTGKRGEEAAGAHVLSPCAVLLWGGDVFDAQQVQQRISQAIPEARYFMVTSASAMHNAERALRRARPAFMPRDLVEHAVDIFIGKVAADPMGLGRVLLVDNFKPTLVQLTAALMNEGYEVAACMKAEDALDQVRADRFHIAVVGAALAYAQHTGVELAQSMREADPDLRIILMVDRYPLQTALQGVSQVVEVGLDDCLLKPVEPSRLRFSISRALERRRLLLENARLLEELQAANGELEQLTGFQSKFFAMVAHDVKNPLTAIRGYAEMLSWKVKDETLLKCVSHIQSSTRTLEGLISDLVDYAAIESGKLRVNMEDINLSHVIADVDSRIQVAAEKRKIKFSTSAPENIPMLRGDPLRLGQVIQNLCTNAIQYTPEGGNVYLKVQLSPTVVTVSVRDTGIGISKEDLPRIFQRFFQAENAQKMRRAGFGLGLKIAQEIVRSHGGGMGVDSELGKGSVFYFTLPVPSGAPAADASEAKPLPTTAAPVVPAPSTPVMGGPYTPMPGSQPVVPPRTPFPGKQPTPPPQGQTPIPPGKTPIPKEPEKGK
ncbi:MAG: ATP-binding protein [Elusimicrobiota bacterium]